MVFSILPVPPRSLWRCRRHRLSLEPAPMPQNPQPTAALPHMHAMVATARRARAADPGRRGSKSRDSRRCGPYPWAEFWSIRSCLSRGFRTSPAYRQYVTGHRSITGVLASSARIVGFGGNTASGDRQYRGGAGRTAATGGIRRSAYRPGASCIAASVPSHSAPSDGARSGLDTDPRLRPSAQS